MSRSISRIDVCACHIIRRRSPGPDLPTRRQIPSPWGSRMVCCHRHGHIRPDWALRSFLAPGVRPRRVHHRWSDGPARNGVENDPLPITGL